MKLQEHLFLIGRKTVLDKCDLSPSLLGRYLRVNQNLQIMAMPCLDIIFVLVKAIQCNGNVPVCPHHVLAIIEFSDEMPI